MVAQDRVSCGVESEPGGADNTGGRSEGKITTVQAAGKPAERRMDYPRAAMVVVVCVLAVACTGRSGPPASDRDQQPISAWPTHGWRTAAPQDQGMDPGTLAGIDDEARLVFPALRSVLVVRHGVLVLERYYHGATQATYFNSFSVTKSVTSALIGIALGEHTLGGLDQPIGRLLATHLPPRPDPRLRSATVEQVLTMTAGLPPDPTDGAPPSLVHAPASDWVRFVLGQHPATTPGSRFAYSSDGSHLLSAIIADATGQTTLRYAQAKLFAPLGIASDDPFEPVFAPRNQAAYQRAGFAWPTDPQGYHLGYGFLKLTARDLAKFGYLYLKGGTWEGRQVIPAAYVRAATQPQVPTGGTFGPFTGYGYQWWTTTEQGHQAFAAMGLGGQLIEVVPDLDLVVVMTSELTTAADVRTGGESHKMVGNVVIPAVRD
jgi:CubicO group peptidase (beta-lactamase class C family)